VLVFDVFIVVVGVKVWNEVKLSLPPEPVPHVRVVSQQWAWSFVHPGPDGRLDTADDIKTVDDLHIQTNQKYVWELESRDVLHSFSIPAMRMKQDAVPGRVIKGWLEICGIGHGLMPAKLHVEDAAAHMAWMQANAPVARIAAN
jgi:cytochrome c oxidase subunit 2